MQAGVGGRQGQGLCSRRTCLAAGKRSGHASVPQQLPATAIPAYSARPARAPGPLQEAITLDRQENPPPRLLPCSHVHALRPCPLLAQGDSFFSSKAAALVAQAHLRSGLWHPCQGTRPGTAPGGDSWPLLLVGTTTASSPHSSRSGMGSVRAAGTLLGSCGQQQCWAPKQGRQGAGCHCCPTGRLTLSSL